MMLWRKSKFLLKFLEVLLKKKKPKQQDTTPQEFQMDRFCY